MATPGDQKLLRQTKFPAEFSQKVDMQKVNIEVMKKWIARKISDILGSEDDVVIELCFNLLEGSRFPDIKSLQIQLTGFLDKDTAGFCKELWALCLSAQTNPQGVPKELLEAKKLELIQEKAEAEKAAQVSQRRKDVQDNKERDVDIIRQRERVERGWGRGDHRGGRGRGRGFDDRRRRFSRSPPPGNRPPPYHPPSRQEADTYVPSRGRGNHSTRGRSPNKSRSPIQSRSRSPPRRVRRNSSSVSSSRSRSPPPKRGHWDPVNRSRSPVRSERVARRRRSSSSLPRDKNLRSTSRSVSRSRATRRDRRHRSISSSRSRSPPPKRHHQRRSYTSSISRSPSRHRKRNGRRSKRSHSPSEDDTRPGKGADIVRTRKTRDDRRLTRSPDDDHRRRTHRRASSSDRSRSRSRSASKRTGHHKRRRSLRRYETAPRRRHNTSSDSSPEVKRRRVSTHDNDPSRSPDEHRRDEKSQTVNGFK